MPRPLTLVLVDDRANRHSINALAAAVEAHAELAEIELAFCRQPELPAEIDGARRRGRRAVIGVSVATAQAAAVERLARDRRLDGGDACWIAGGPHATAAPAEVLKWGFDAVVCGEGEATLAELLSVLAAGGDMASVAGVAARQKPSPGPPRPPVDLDRYGPFPLVRRRVVGPIEITRGCPFACGYCQTSHLLGMRPRHRSVDVVARYAAVIRQRNLRDVRFVSPNALAYGSADGRRPDLAAVERLLRAVRETIGPDGRLFFGTFPSEVRPEHVTAEALALIRRYADNDNLIIGAQSGSDRLLAACHRGHGADEVFEAVRLTLAAGLTPQVDFIFGLPGETRRDVQTTMAAIERLAGQGAQIHAHAFMPLPGTAMADSRPALLPDEAAAAIERLGGAGRLYGQWRRQQRDAAGTSRNDRD